jgi:hypothetical protein
MQISLTKGRHDDRVVMRRADGTEAVAVVPHKGPVPHDAVHYFVEQGLGFSRGFWGMIAAGIHPDELVELAKAGGHASATRAQVPDAAIVELLQAERLVECFEADLWSGTGSDDSLLAMAGVACAASLVPVPRCAPGAIAAVRDAIAVFACEWMDADEGYVARLDWP